MGQKLLDNHFVASVILWGQMNKLIKSTTDELQEGNKVLQPASVYGKFSIRVAEVSSQLRTPSYLYRK